MPHPFPVLLLLGSLVGCATRQERAVHRAFEADPYGLGEIRASSAEPDPASLASGLDGLLTYALAGNPSLAAAHARWEAATHRVIAARRPPEPEIMVAVFAQQSEMVIGRERARAGVKQALPWPQGLAARADAAASEATAQERRLDAEVLAIREQVATAYWALWSLREAEAVVANEQAALEAAVDAAVSAQIAGSQGVGPVQRASAWVIRAQEQRLSLQQQARKVEAALVEAVGARPGTAIPTPHAPPEPAMPEDDEAALRARAQAAPAIEALTRGSEASAARARAEAVARLPGVVLGVEWMEMAPGVMEGQPTPGRDAVMVSLGMRVPLWQRSYGASVRAEVAEASARELDARSARDRAAAELTGTLATLEDLQRRLRRIEGELSSVLDAAWQGALSDLISGRGTLTDALLLWRDRLDLAQEALRLRADHAAAWARLERIVGGPVARREAS